MSASGFSTILLGNYNFHAGTDIHSVFAGKNCGNLQCGERQNISRANRVQERCGRPGRFDASPGIISIGDCEFKCVLFP
jgi:hypothetical protein